jgi:hypothetical protein
MITVGKPGVIESLACEIGGCRQLAAFAGDDGERKRCLLANLWQEYKNALLGISGRED